MFKERWRRMVWVVLFSSLLGMSPLLAQGLGKFSEWSRPVNLGPKINSEFRDDTPALSPNGRSLYFISDRPGGFGGLDMYVSQRPSLEDPWEEPKNLGPTINSEANEWTPFFSSDGHWLYFASIRSDTCGGNDLYVAYREDLEDDFGWNSPVNLGCLVNSAAHEFAPHLFEDQVTGTVTLYFHRNPGDLGRANIYESTLRGDGVFGRAALVWELSSPEAGWGPAPRLDGLELFLNSDRPGTLGGFDIWVSTRETPQDAWSMPENLGPTVNSPADEHGGKLSPDGTALYFGSDRPGGYGDVDLYVTTRKKLQE